MTKSRTLTFVQKRIVQVRAERLAFLERAASGYHAGDVEQKNAASAERGIVGRGRSLFRGEVEPEVVVAEDGTVSLAPLEWSTEASDATEQ